MWRNENGEEKGDGMRRRELERMETHGRRETRREGKQERREIWEKGESWEIHMGEGRWYGEKGAGENGNT